MSKPELAELLWEGAPPTGYVTTLESYVSVLRRRLDPSASVRNSVVLTRTGGYALDASRVSEDLWKFDGLLDRADGLPATAALPLLEQALALASQPLLADEACLSWAADDRQRHSSRVVAAATAAAEHALALGDTRRTDDLAARATDLDNRADVPDSPVIQLLARTERLARRVGSRQPAALGATA